jgi:hypothetical protein
MNPVFAYGRAHPGSVLEPALLRDAHGHAVAYVLTSDDPAPIAAALAKSYGESVCVRRSLHTRAQLDAACQVMLPPDPGPHLVQGACDALDSHAQLHVDVYTTWIVQTEVNLAAAQPTGLVRLSAWLEPQTTWSSRTSNGPMNMRVGDRAREPGPPSRSTAGRRASVLSPT